MFLLAAIFVVSTVIGLLLGGLGRFPLFAVSAVSIVALLALAGILGDWPLGQWIVVTFVSLAGLQIGYALLLFARAARVARNRRRSRARSPAREPAATGKESRPSPGYERIR